MTATVEPRSGPAVPAPDPPRRPRSSRLSAGHLLIALAAIVAVVANYAALRAHDDRVRVAVVAADVAAGEAVERGALAFADVRADDALLATLLTPGDLGVLDGHVAATTLTPGELLRRSDLQPTAAPQGRRAMSVALPPEHAVGGRLAAGDRVDVIEVRDGAAVYLVTDAQVLDVPSSEGRAGLGALRTFSVTLAVDDRTALRLALAQRHGELHLVRSTGAQPATIEGLRDTDAPDGTGAGSPQDSAGDRAGAEGGVAGDTEGSQSGDADAGDSP